MNAFACSAMTTTLSTRQPTRSSTIVHQQAWHRSILRHPRTAKTSASRKSDLLRALGSEVRARRQASNFTLRALAEATQVSERFLVQLEQGEEEIFRWCVWRMSPPRSAQRRPELLAQRGEGRNLEKSADRSGVSWRCWVCAALEKARWGRAWRRSSMRHSWSSTRSSRAKPA